MPKPIKLLSTLALDDADTKYEFVAPVQRPERPSSQLWAPHAYQRKSVKWLLSRRGAALFLDPGLGKTSITYAALKVLLAQGLSKGALVIAPRRPAQSVWPKEQQKWTDFSGLRVVLLHGDKKDELLADAEAEVYVITYEGIEWLFKEPPARHEAYLDSIPLKGAPVPKKGDAEYARLHAEYLALRKVHRARLKVLFSKVNVLVFDELSKMKHPSTVRFRSIKKHLSDFAYRWGLTGSPASNGLTDLFGQAFVLDLGEALGPFITHFRSRYFDLVLAHPNDEYPDLVPKPGAEREIYAKMKNLALRIDAEDHLQLPQIIYNPIKFDLPANVRALYAQMERDMFMRLPDTGKKFTARTAATVSQKCRQITSGAIYEDLIDPDTGEPIGKNRKWDELHTVKMDMLDELIDELQGQQLLVGYEFVHEVARILKRKGKNTPVIGGGTSDKRAKFLEDEWNAGRLPQLYGHPASIGHGLNLQESSAYHVLWLSGTWDYELWDQFIRRLKRQGNAAKHLFVHLFIARDTIDEAVYASTQRKRADQNALLNALKDYRSGRK